MNVAIMHSGQRATLRSIRRVSPACEVLEDRIALSSSFDAIPFSVQGGPSTQTVTVGHYHAVGEDRPFLAATYLGPKGQLQGGVEIFVEDGSGGFKSFQSIPIENSAPEGIIAGRFTGTAFDDLIVADNQSKVVLIRGLPDGHFGGAETLKAIGAVTPTYLAAITDASGRPDRLIVAAFAYKDPKEGSVQVYKFGGPDVVTLEQKIKGVAKAEEVVLGDFNRDGRMDFAVTNLLTDDPTDVTGKTGFVSVFQAGKNGKFTASRVDLKATKGGPGRAIKAIGLVSEDFDGDGFADLAVPEFVKGDNPGQEVHFLRNVSARKGKIRFVDEKRIDAGGEGIAAVAAVDLGDGHPGLAVSASNSNLVTFIHNRGHFRFTAPDPAESFVTPDGPGILITADLARGQPAGVLDLIVPVGDGINVYRHKKTP